MSHTWIRIYRGASKYSTPLSIVSVVITGLYGLYRIILEKSDFERFEAADAFLLVDKVVTYLFVLSLVGLLLGVGAFLATRIGKPKGKAPMSKPTQGRSTDPYEYLKWVSIWDIKDADGQSVQYIKNLTVRFLQPNVSVITDRVWGNGETMCNYRSSLGTPADVFDYGQSRKVLISLRGNQKEGSEAHFTISRTIRGGFTKEEEWIEEDPGYFVKKYALRVIFPLDRPCRRAVLTLRRANVTEELSREAFNFTPDGRQEILVFLRDLQRERVLLRWWW